MPRRNHRPPVGEPVPRRQPTAEDAGLQPAQLTDLAHRVAAAAVTARGMAESEPGDSRWAYPLHGIADSLDSQAAALRQIARAIGRRHAP
jgi:hypothetical protein